MVDQRELTRILRQIEEAINNNAAAAVAACAMAAATALKAGVTAEDAMKHIMPTKQAFGAPDLGPRAKKIITGMLPKAAKDK